LNKDLTNILERLLYEHKWMERVAIKYIEETLSYYRDKGIDYEKYIIPFLKILEEELLTPHYRFEEETIFPLFPDDPFVEELKEEHKRIEELVNKFRATEGGLEVLEELSYLLNEHIDKEEAELTAKLKKLIEDDIDLIK